MKLNFIKANPTENMTLFVLDPLPRSMYMDIAKKIMAYSNVYAEQVGFLENTSSADSKACVRLQMMGGEFCGNATRALAAVLVQRGHCKIQRNGDKYLVPLEVSGVHGIIDCEVEAINDYSYISTVKMPVPKAIKDITIKYEGTNYQGTLVEFPGIIHLVIDSENIASKEAFFEAVKEQFKTMTYDALGIMFFNKKDSYIEPLVYVRSTESLIWERGCGSGTAALGATISHHSQKGIDMIVNQPGGQLEISTKWSNNKPESIYLKGTVKIVAEGVAYI